jgi:hypothetical protein
MNNRRYVVHGATVRHFGLPNKNVGDAFLLVWRFETSSGASVPEEEVADSALLAFLQILHEVDHDQELKAICQNSNLQRKFKGYVPRFGFGLHIGSCVEGAIGTPEKIDTTYLSNDVKLSERVQDACKVFKTEVMLTEPFFNTLTEHMQCNCRFLDRVPTAASSSRSGTLDAGLRLYCHDRCAEFFKTDRAENLDEEDEMVMLNPNPGCALSNAYFSTPSSILDEHREFCALYTSATHAFLAGDWVKARALYTDCLRFKDDDTAGVFLEEITKYQDVPPEELKRTGVHADFRI